ncbi:MAG: hypothetical protein J6L91_03395 [Clostridia bacterium]|nr:hypothetical protein [Clostridia bacterium]
MKRFIAIVLFILIIFSSCDNGIIKNGVSLNVNSLNTAFSLKVKDVVYSGEMKSDKNGALTLLLNSPDDINGLVISVNGNETVTQFDKIRLPVSSDDNAFSQLYKAVEALRTAKEFTHTPDGFELKNDDFGAVLDSQGNLKWMKVNNGEFYFNN